MSAPPSSSSGPSRSGVDQKEEVMFYDQDVEMDMGDTKEEEQNTDLEEESEEKDTEAVVDDPEVLDLGKSHTRTQRRKNKGRLNKRKI